jgi:hypothetical protein
MSSTQATLREIAEYLAEARAAVDVMISLRKSGQSETFQEASLEAITALHGAACSVSLALDAEGIDAAVAKVRS